MKTLIVILIILSLVYAERNYIHPPAFPNQHEYLVLFRQWMADYGKVYEPREFIKRFNIWKDNVDYIYDRNTQIAGSYELAVNMFADLTHEEWVALYLNTPEYPARRIEPTSVKSQPKPLDLPTKFDWRDTDGVVQGVGDQTVGCIASYAWSAAGTVEGERAITHTLYTELTKQQMVDCDSANNGCAGGTAAYAFDYIAVTNGICSEYWYPWKAKDLDCYECKYTVSHTDISATNSVKQNEQALKNAVYYQPVSVGIDADDTDFTLYKTGIYAGPCVNNKVNSYALVVGWGVNESDALYWIMKNSWGTGWGISGYMNLTRTESDSDVGKCGIALLAAYVTLP